MLLPMFYVPLVFQPSQFLPSIVGEVTPMADAGLALFDLVHLCSLFKMTVGVSEMIEGHEEGVVARSPVLSRNSPLPPTYV